MIDYVDGTSLDPAVFMRRFRRPGRPAVITGCFADTPPWTLDHLAGQLGDSPYATRHYGAGHFDEAIYQWSKYCKVKQLTFAEYAGLLTDGTAHAERMYFAQIGIGATPAGESIAANFDTIAARTGMALYGEPNIWLGPANHTEPLHFDLGEGTLVQLKGAKRVSLFPPRAARGLYPFPAKGSRILPWFSQVDIERPDLERFPRLAGALRHRIDVVLREGETLFIPAFWWHQVAADSPEYVCSVNRFWNVAPRRRLLTNGSAPLAAVVHQRRRMAARRRAQVGATPQSAR